CSSDLTNFLMTMRGSRKAIEDSYVLPFMLVGVIFYFVGSTQGSFQAFRFTNYIWHFTDFNVGHSHITMYGIIAFFLWGSIYAIMPKRSEEHTSELQSRENLVCRLLLEKKKKNYNKKQYL